MVCLAAYRIAQTAQLLRCLRPYYLPNLPTDALLCPNICHSMANLHKKFHEAYSLNGFLGDTRQNQYLNAPDTFLRYRAQCV